MAGLKTQKNNASVSDFLNSVTDDRRREDGIKLCQIMQEVTGENPEMWGSSIVGFGSYHYKYVSGREGDWPKAGFSPRKQNLTLYIMDALDQYEPLLEKLGPHTRSKACIYIKKLDQLDEEVLRELIAISVKNVESGNVTL